MTKRKIIKIDEEKCNGCGLCIPNCPEGALQMIDGKARLVSDLCCDGLGACLGHCPQGAIEIEERDAEQYDERKVMENIVKHGKNTIKAHLKHLKDHKQDKYLEEAIEFLYDKNIKNPLGEEKMQHKNSMNNENDLPCGCPGTAMREVNNEDNSTNNESGNSSKQDSALRQWPVQLNLLPSHAPFFEGSHLLVAADCVPFANANFHSQLLHGKSLIIGCPKLDDIESYKEKLTDIFKENNIKSVTVAIMEVPCCCGMYSAVEEAMADSGKNVPIIKEVISVSGEIA